MTHQIDLSENHLSIVMSILERDLPDSARIWMFGSRAKGNAKKYSDIDLLVDLGYPISLEILTKLSLDFEESKLPYKVDIADYSTISESFKENIADQLVPLKITSKPQ